MEELPALVNFLVNNPAGKAVSAEIAHARFTWSRQVLRDINISIYMYRLMLEMASLSHGNDLEQEDTGGGELDPKYK